MACDQHALVVYAASTTLCAAPCSPPLACSPCPLHVPPARCMSPLPLACSVLLVLSACHTLHGTLCVCVVTSLHCYKVRRGEDTQVAYGGAGRPPRYAAAGCCCCCSAAAALAAAAAAASRRHCRAAPSSCAQPPRASSRPSLSSELLHCPRLTSCVTCGGTRGEEGQGGRLGGVGSRKGGAGVRAEGGAAQQTQRSRRSSAAGAAPHLLAGGQHRQREAPLLPVGLV